MHMRYSLNSWGEGDTVTYRIELYKVGCRCLPSILTEGLATLKDARQYISDYIAREYPTDAVKKTVRKYPDIGTRKETTVVNFGKKAIDNEHRLSIYEVVP